jgi:hypothetical protein
MYILIDEATGESAVVDPYDATKIHDAAAKEGAKVGIDPLVAAEQSTGHRFADIRSPPSSQRTTTTTTREVTRRS